MIGTVPAPTPTPASARASKVMIHVGKVKITDQDMSDAADAFRGIGHSIQEAWANRVPDVTSALKLPVLNSLSSTDKQNVMDSVLGVARDVGYGAAGVSLVSGVARLHSKGARRWEGVASIAMAGAIATTVSGMVAPALVLMPLAGAAGIARGALNTCLGVKNGDQRQVVAGVVDSTRSVGTIATGLEPVAALTSTLTDVATVCSVVGNGIQVARGLIDLHQGVAVHDDRKELNGLTDIGMAAGGLIAATGVGAIPGIALTAASVALKLGYVVAKPVRTKTNAVLDEHQAGLKKAVDKADVVINPMIDGVDYIIRDVMGHIKHKPS